MSKSHQREDALDAIAGELRNESFSSLRKLSEKLELAVARFRESEAVGGEVMLQCRAAAAEALWKVIVQREAMGFGRHDYVYSAYGVPPVIVALMGPQKKRA
jgi:hypothetical protein